MIASWSVSSGEMARMLPMVIVCTETETGFIDTMKRPRPKKAVKISPITTSIFSPDRSERRSIAAAARPPARKAPRAKGRPSM